MPSNFDETNDALDRKVGKFHPALIALLEAVECAKDTNCDCWEFAIAIKRFEKLGLSRTDLRWLARKGYVEYAQEITRREDTCREFRPRSNLSFCKRTCFVLTVAGLEYAHLISQRRAASTNHRCTEFEDYVGIKRNVSSNAIELIPVWDAERRELRFKGDLVKQFKWPAVNQETILAAFEEEHWPMRVLDPLPPHPEQASKRRLNDTIKCLNRKQKNPLIHFRGDGTGEGVVWELVDLTGNAGAIG